MAETITSKNNSKRDPHRALGIGAFVDFAGPQREETISPAKTIIQQAIFLANSRDSTDRSNACDLLIECLDTCEIPPDLQLAVGHYLDRLSLDPSKEIRDKVRVFSPNITGISCSSTMFDGRDLQPA